MQKIKEAAMSLAKELVIEAELKKGQVVVIGCSTSEIKGARIGSDSNEDIAEELFHALKTVFDKDGIYIAAQCCEHLNRAIVIEKEAVKDAQIVNALPQPKAGGAFASVAYRSFNHPVLLEEIRADAGIDIGGTFIGMHLKKVAVPLRLSIRKIGEATVLAARTRPKFIGGIRTVYDETLL